MNILSNIEKFTVSQLNYSIKNLIENKFQIVSVIGEVSQVKKHGSGHIYFSLKDEESVISAICWRSVVPRLKINLEDGIKVEIKVNHAGKENISLDSISKTGKIVNAYNALIAASKSKRK